MIGTKLVIIKVKILNILYNIWDSIGTKYGWHQRKTLFRMVKKKK